MSENQYALRMKNISKRFPGVVALEKVSIDVRPGTVHALMGENGAGKSTLMKCLFGLYHPDEGEIELFGRTVTVPNSKSALDLGISMIHQELHPIPNRSIMENIWLGRFPEKKIGFVPFIDHKTMYNRTLELFKEFNIEVDPRVEVRNISVSTVQSVEIVKAVSYNSKIIIMDEPTSSLTEHEVDHLFKIIRMLKKKGVAILYISHKMSEILKISDEVTIMRDGRKVGTWPSSELTTDKIISRMVGRDMSQWFPDKGNIPSSVIMKVDGFNSPIPRSFKNASFELRKGEILGFGGLVGAQRTELLEAVFGLRTKDKGVLYIGNREVRIQNPGSAKQYRMALLTEDRRGTGIFPVLSVHDNVLMANWKIYQGKTLLLNNRKMKKDAVESVEKLRIKTPSIQTLIRNLSGGNQQKVLIARWLLTEPDILILDEPTRGIDVGAKYEIYKLIVELAERGKSIIMISSEMPELLGMTDRIVVMCEGKVAGILNSKEANEEAVMRLATKFMVETFQE